MTERSARYVASLGVGFALMLGQSGALADEREQCASAADKGQQMRDEGKYRGAREQFLSCAREVCPGPIRKDCSDWLNQVESVAPSVVIAAKENGKDLTDVKVWMDGVSITERLDGKPIPVDIGEHTFKFEYQGQTKEEKVLIGAGQRGRNLSVVFGAGATEKKPVPEQPNQTEGSLVPAFVVGGIGIVALGSFAIFGLSGKSEVSDLESTCKPHCAESDVDKARTKLIIADISLGVGIVALGVATYLVLTRPKIPAEVKTGFKSVRFDGGPTQGGAVGGLSGRF